MRKRILAPIAAVLMPMAALIILLGLLSGISLDLSEVVFAAPAASNPTVLEVDPASGPNDLDTLIVITGTDFAAPPTVTLGTTALDDARWTSATQLTATVPWGLEPGVYTLTVENPDGGSASLTDAFTVTEAIGVWNATELYGGRMDQVTVHPDRQYPMYAVSDQVGLFRKEGEGAAWELIYPGQHLKLVISPADPDRLYIDAGTAYRSDDRGDTWTMLPKPDQCGHLYPIPHPTISDTVFAINPYVTDTGHGVWKSKDGGQTWISKTEGLTDTLVVDLTYHPSDPMTMAVGTHSGNVFVSYSGGDEWSFAAKPVNFLEMLTFTPLDEHVLWASANWYYGTTSTHWTNTDDFTVWEQVPDPVGSKSMAHAYFGETNWGAAYSQTVFLATSFKDTYKSEDGGATWSDYGINAADLALQASAPNTVYAAHPSDGIHKTDDDGVNWQPMNDGLTGVAPDALAASSLHPDVIYAVDRELYPAGIYRGTEGGAAWKYETIDDLNANTVMADPFGSGYVYAAGTGWESDMSVGRVCVSDDGGENWNTPCGLITAPTVYSETSFGGLELTPADPVNPGTLLAGAHHYRFRPGSSVLHAGSIYTSTDNGENWTWIDVGEPISPVTDLAYDHLTPTIIYASTGVMGEGSGLYRSSNTGETWRRVGEEHPALDYVEDLAVEPEAPYRIFAQPGNMGEGLYVSEDHGDTWRPALSPLSWRNVHQLLFTPDTAVLYAATEGGLLATADGAHSWSRASGELGQVPVYSLAAVTDTDRVILYAGTTGGAVEETQSQVQARGISELAASAGNDSLVNAGVYRYTTRRPKRVYLPLVLRTY